MTKLCLLLLTCSVLTLHAGISYSQQVKLNLEMKNVSLSDVIYAIKQQTEFEFAYDSNLESLIVKEISINALNEKIDNVLASILQGTEINYRVIDKIILLSKNTVRITSGLEDRLALQQQKVTGIVTDATTGEPITGANIIVEGTTFGTISDAEGKFSIDVPDQQSVLVISFIGYLTEKIVVTNQKTIDVKLVPDIKSLEEVVVIGYGTLQIKELTSSVTSLKEKDFISGISSSPLMGIHGKVTGLSIVSSNGSDPNARVSLQLRGANSVNASQGPLIVIDGVPGGSLNSVAREDIKSIDVLKDASAAAIYGTRASGGVILITTKRAQEGPLVITYSGEFSTEKVRRKAESLSADEFVSNKLGTDLGHKTDWFDVVTVDNPFSQRNTITLSGGSKTAKVYASLFSKNAEGIGLGSSRKEMGGRLNANYSAFDGKVEISAHASYSTAKAKFTDNDIFKMALKLNPTETPYNSKDVTGYNVITGGWQYYNPLAKIKLEENSNSYKYLIAGVTLKWNITKNLYSSIMAATNDKSEQPIFWRSSQAKESRENNISGYASQEYKKWDNKTFEWLAGYNKSYDVHDLKLVGGYSFQEFNGEGISLRNENFPVDGVKWHDMGQGTFLSDGRAGLGSWKDPTERLIAFFGRLNYSFSDKYLLSISSRYEGSSKFAPNTRWGMFPAVSVGWRISNETFMKSLSFISDLKLRAGYGITGNEGFGGGVSSRMYASDTWWLLNGKWIKTHGLDHNVNKNLEWETKKEYNFGLDFSLFNDRLSGKLDVYQRTSDNLIYDISVSQPPAIHDKTTMNVGSLRNRGFEAELTWNAINKKDLTYSTTIRVSHNTNTLVSLYGNQTFMDRKYFPAPGSPGSSVRLFPGKEIGQFYIWKFAGFTKDGNWMLVGKDGKAFDASDDNRPKTNEDKQFMGNAIPKVILSWENSFTWKNFDLNMYFRSWLGYDVFNMIDMYYGLSKVSGQNILKEAYDKNKNIKGEKELCDYWIEKGDFIKLDNLALGYTVKIPALNMYVKNLRFYFSAKDLFTITKYSGIDPEVNINGLEPGFEELDVYPKTRIFTLGIQATF